MEAHHGGVHPDGLPPAAALEGEALQAVRPDLMTECNDMKRDSCLVEYMSIGFA